MVVGVDGIAADLAVDASLRRVDGRDRELGAHVLERNVLGHQLGWIELNTNGGLLLAADGDQADARDLADLLGKLRVGIVVHLDQRHGLRRCRQYQDGRVGGVDLAIRRRCREVSRKLSAGSVDRGLNVVGRRIDIAIEIELNDHCGRAQPARRRYLRYARYLRELALQRLRH